MNIVNVNVESCAGLDRLATRNEITCAMSQPSQDNCELAGACDDFREAYSDFTGRACYLSENTMWLAIINEMADSISN